MPRRLTWGIQPRAAIKLVGAVSLVVLPAAALLASNSRMALAASLVSLGLVGWMTTCHWTWWTASGLAILLAGAMFSFSALHFKDEPRFAIWRDAVPVARSYALTGCGLGSFESALHPFKKSAPLARYDFAHNDYLQLFVELGVIGSTLLLALLLLTARSVWRTTRAGHGDRRAVAIACGGAIAAVAVHSLADFNLYIPANAMACAWVLGIGSGLIWGKSMRRVIWTCLLLTLSTASWAAKTVGVLTADGPVRLRGIDVPAAGARGLSVVSGDEVQTGQPARIRLETTIP